jgi:hypothetical protein
MTERGVVSIDPAGFRRSLMAAAIPVLAVPIVIGLVMSALGVELRLGPLVAGAVGWLVALGLRAPIVLATMRLSRDRERSQPWIVASSGPLEEGVRLIVVLLVGRDLDTALSIGLGWAAVEVVYALINGVALLSLMTKEGSQAEEARAIVSAMGLLDVTAPWWGVVERASASLLHIGFTLIIAAAPILVVITAPVHSAVNLGVVRAARRRVPMSQIQGSLVIVGLLVLAVGIVLWR